MTPPTHVTRNRAGAWAEADYYLYNVFSAKGVGACQNQHRLAFAHNGILAGPQNVPTVTPSAPDHECTGFNMMHQMR